MGKPSAEEELKEVLRKAEKYLEQFDNRELVTTPEARTYVMGIIIGGKKKGEAVFADLLGQAITNYRVQRSGGPFRIKSAYELVMIVDRGLAHGLIVVGKGVFKRLRECQKHVEELQEELERLRVENARLKEENDRLRAGRDKFISP